MVEKLQSQQKFYEDLAYRESSGKWDTFNKYGYLGAFQMGEAALDDAGYYKQNKNGAKWSGEWTGKNGVWSKEDYLKNKDAQIDAVMVYHRKNWQYLRDEGALAYIGKEINGVKITPSALIAGAHIGGHAKVLNFLKTNGSNDGKDANGVPVSEYMKKFNNYDTYDVTGMPTLERYKKERGIKDPKYTPAVVNDKFNTFNDKKMSNNIEREREYFYNVKKEYEQYVEDVIKYGKDKADKKLYKDNNTNKKSILNIDGIKIDNNKLVDLPEGDQADFWEGFDKNEIGNPKDYPFDGVKTASKEKDWTKKFNTGNPDTDDGHWVTMPNGKHLFIKDKVG